MARRSSKFQPPKEAVPAEESESPALVEAIAETTQAPGGAETASPIQSEPATTSDDHARQPTEPSNESPAPATDGPTQPSESSQNDSKPVPGALVSDSPDKTAEAVEGAVDRAADGGGPASVAGHATGVERDDAVSPASASRPTPLEPAQAPSSRLTPPSPESHRGTGLLTGLVLGLLLAALGFGGGWYLSRPGGPLAPPPGPELSQFASRLAALETRLQQTAPAADLAGLQAAQTALAQRLDAAEQAAGAAQTQASRARDALSARLDELAQRPPATDPEASATYSREIAAIRQMVADEIAALKRQAAAADASRAEAAQARQRAQATSALAQIRAAIDSGAGFQPALEMLAEALPQANLAALQPLASGVPTLTALRESFPEAARAALAAARAGESGGARAFLEAQLGLRSLTPRAGDSADAILSRAEAALAQGDLQGALSTLATLPAPAQAALADWREQATRRQAALSALATLEASLTEAG